MPDAAQSSKPSTLPLYLQDLNPCDEVETLSELSGSVLEILRGHGAPGVSAVNIIEALAMGSTIFQDPATPARAVIKISEEIVAKIGPVHESLTEYYTLEYLQRHAPEAVPAPKPMGMVQFGHRRVMFSSYIPGVSLQDVWPGLSYPQKGEIQSSLDDMFSQLRLIRPLPGTLWGDVSGAGCLDMRRDERRSPTSIASAREFNEFVFGNPRYGSLLWTNFLKQVGGSKLRDDHCVFTHGDLRPANIIVQTDDQGHYTISGVVDWECSGWYPAYWEAAKMTNCLEACETSDWYIHLPKSIGPSAFPVQWLLDRLWGAQVE